MEFFDQQFKAQIKAGDFELNPFETLSLEYLQGRVLDLGCGLGNLSLAAGGRGHPVLAVEISAAAIQRIRRDAALESLPVVAVEANALEWEGDGEFDTVVCIGLLMFFRKKDAYRLLQRMTKWVGPAGRIILNVLIEGTDFFDMFKGDQYHLFKEEQIMAGFGDWELLLAKRDTFPAPHETRKEFLTLVLQRAVSQR